MLVNMPRERELRINACTYSLEYAALEVYLAGCTTPHCPGCHNKDLWDFRNGAPLPDWTGEIERWGREYGNLIERVWVLGGEPLDQKKADLVNLLTVLRATFPGRSFWLFTRYPKEEVPKYILPLVSFVKSGPYKEELGKTETLHVDGIKLKLGSKNQKIYRVTKSEDPNGRGSAWELG